MSLRQAWQRGGKDSSCPVLNNVCVFGNVAGGDFRGQTCCDFFGVYLRFVCLAGIEEAEF